MADTTNRKAPAKKRTFEVLVSFNGLNKGDRFDQDADDSAWAEGHVWNGYLREVTEEGQSEQRGEVGQG